MNKYTSKYMLIPDKLFEIMFNAINYQRGVNENNEINFNSHGVNCVCRKKTEGQLI